MIKKILLFLTLLSILLFNTELVLAKTNGESCTPGKDTCDNVGDQTYSCQFFQQLASGQIQYTCQEASVEKIFGKINPPDALVPFLKNDPSGAKGISKFLGNLVALIFTMSSIALIFMLVWGAFEWLTSGGDKEQLAKARNRIINAIIAIILLAAVFAILDVLHIFTGFEFFQGPPAACIVNGQNICGRR